MNIQYERARYTMFLFGFLFLFLILDFIVVGTSGFYTGFNRLLTAIIIFIVLVAFFTMLYITNKQENIVDERDRMIQQKATSIALLCTTLFVFLLSISLYIVYESSRVVPVSWMWFIAYFTFTFAYFSSSTIVYVMYKRM